jgi:hypothetical protein
MSGCPGAFVDFFYLTTPCDGVGDDNPTTEELHARRIEPDRYTVFIGIRTRLAPGPGPGPLHHKARDCESQALQVSTHTTSQPIA